MNPYWWRNPNRIRNTNPSSSYRRYNYISRSQYNYNSYNRWVRHRYGHNESSSSSNDVVNNTPVDPVDTPVKPNNPVNIPTAQKPNTTTQKPEQNPNTTTQKPDSIVPQTPVKPPKNHRSYKIDKTVYPIKRALMIGITYTGRQQLDSSVLDMENYKKYLLYIGFKEDEIIIMTDSVNKFSPLYPSKRNIMKALHSMVRFANSHDKPVLISLYYTGHGTTIADKNNDEHDGKDECLVPVDYKSAGLITDDYIFSDFISKFGKNTTLICFIDACNSGTCTDLCYNYKIDKKNYAQSLPVQKKYTKQCDAKCVCFSSSRDDQFSIATTIDSKQMESVFTWAFLQVYKKSTSLASLLTNIQMKINERFGEDKVKQELQISTTFKTHLDKSIFPNQL